MVAVLGIDPGRRWTAGVLRVGADALDGWTLGPVAPDGRPDATALDNVHDLTAWGRWMARIVDAVERTIEQYGAPVRLATEVVVPPGGRIALADWLIPRQVVAGLLAFDPGTILVRPDGHGKAHYDRDGAGRLVRARPVQAAYPVPFHPGARPSTWGPSEARRGERDHERAAYDIAGAALAILGAS
ncbi:hypothetical protein [Streptosporangium saharense]|uniref:Holliday junction resolvase RuvC n=1 Tax=Streptosporangium saharense TaxID=1706840 RepID=A0A7W7QWB4_9ACTN|nr:hypothetical protein [Streptosporangium saharense]MBB4920995.1 hypothetical protein [Streptosporangium saharense]